MTRFVAKRGWLSCRRSALRHALITALAGCCILQTCILQTAAAAAMTLQDLLASMSAVTLQRGSFVERKTIGVLDKPLVVSGTLLYRRPDFLERRAGAPAEELMTVKGDRLTIEWPARQERRTLTLSSNPVAWAFVESIRATLAGDGATLERFYWITVSGDLSHWTLTLEPRAAGVASFVKGIILSGVHSMIARVEVMEANGDHSVMDIQPLE